MPEQPFQELQKTVYEMAGDMKEMRAEIHGMKETLEAKLEATNTRVTDFKDERARLQSSVALLVTVAGVIFELISRIH